MRGGYKKSRSELNEIEKLCFSCDLPPEACGVDSLKCKFIAATEHKKSMRYHTLLKQESCGVPEPPDCN